jgi:hypothetical protein
MVLVGIDSQLSLAKHSLHERSASLYRRQSRLRVTLFASLRCIHEATLIIIAARMARDTGCWLWEKSETKASVDEVRERSARLSAAKL